MTVEIKTAGLIKWKVWCRRVGIDLSTGLRWRDKGRITPSVNIDGLLYLTDTDLESFLQRAKAGEFRGEIGRGGKLQSGKNSPR